MTTDAKVRLKATDESKGAWDSFIANAQRAEAAVNKTAGASALFARVSGALAVGVAAAAFAARTKETIDYADELNKLSQRTGMAASTLSQYLYAANLANVSNETFTKGVRELNKSIVAAISGDEQKIKSFRALGITQDDLGKGTERVMLKIATSYAGTADGAKKAASAASLLGSKTGDELIPLLNLGADGLEKMKREAIALGITISDQFAAQAEEFNDNLTKLKRSSDALYVAVGSDLVKGLGEATKAMVNATIEGGRLQGVLAGVKTLALGTAKYQNDKRMVELTERQFELMNEIDRLNAAPVKMPGRLAVMKGELIRVNEELSWTLHARGKLEESERREREAAAAANNRPDPDVPDGAAAAAAAAKRNRALDAQIAAVQGRSRLLQEIAKRDADTLESEFKRGILSQQDYVEAAAQAEVNALADQRRALEQVLALVQRKDDSEKQAAEVRAQIAEVDAKMASRRVKYDNDALEMLAKRKSAADAVYASQQEEARNERTMADLEADKRYRAMVDAVRAYGQTIDDSNDQVRYELGLMGHSEQGRARAIEQYRVLARLREELRRIDDASRGGDLTWSQVQELRAKAQAAAARELSGVQQKLLLDEWNRTTQTINESLTDALLRGFEDGKGFAENFRDTVENMFRTMVLRPVIAGILSPVSAGMATVTQGIVGSAGQSLIGSQLTQGLGFAGAGAGVFGTAGAYAAAVPGLTSTAAGSQAAMLAAQTEAFGAAGLTSTAAAGGSGAAGALAAIPGWGWAALGAAALLGSGVLGGKAGGPKSDGRYGFINSGIASGQYDGQVAGVVQGIQAQYEAYVRSMGGVADRVFGAGVSTDPAGSSPSFVDVTASRNGQTLWTRLDRGVGRDEASVQQALAHYTQMALLQALKDADLKGGLADWLRGVDVESDVEAIYARVGKALGERATLEQRLADLTDTALQKLNKTRAAERASIDVTNRSLADQVYAQEDLATAGGVLKEAWDRESQARQRGVDDLRGAAAAMREFRDELLLGEGSILSAPQRLAEAERRFNATYAAAQGGDTNAIGQLREASGTYMELLKATARSRAEYNLGSSRVLAALSITATAADAKATVEEQQLDIMKAQLTEFGLLNENFQTFAQALAAYQAAQEVVAQAKAAVIAADSTYTPATVSTTASLAQAQGPAPWVDTSQTFGYWEASGFATGTPGFTGGVRTVGETGVEIENTGPARIFSAAQTSEIIRKAGDFTDVVRAVDGLRAEVAAQRSTLTQMGIKQGQMTGDVQKLAKVIGFDPAGGPVLKVKAVA